MCDQSHCCPVLFSSQTTQGLIGFDSSVLVLAYTTPIQSIKSLSYLIFVINRTWSNQSWYLNIVFGIDHTYTIGHVVALSGFHDRPYPIQSIMTTQFHFRSRLHVEDRSHRCSSWFDRSWQLSFVLGVFTLIWSIMSFSYLVFVIDRTQSHKSQQRNFFFNVDRIWMIGRVIVLYDFRHKSHPIWSITTTQFHFRHRPHPYNPSHRCFIWFSS